jgi:MarR family 2-MHQ and catechol resistance regulon transcriptional repressor
MWKATKALEAHARRSVEASGLCLSDFGGLEALLHKGPLPVSELGKKVLLTSGSVTAAVDRLERGGWVERAEADADRRSRIVHLTPAGTRLIRGVFAEHERDMDRAFRTLTDAELANLVSILRKLGRGADGLAGPGEGVESGRQGKRRARRKEEGGRR